MSERDGMNSQDRRTLSETIIQACKNTFLEDEKMKTIKGIARKNDDFVKVAFDQLWHQFEVKNSQTRYIALLICYELFKRSKCFRELMAEYFPQFIELTIVGGKPTDKQRETSSRYKTHLYERKSNSASIHASVLPPPKHFANQLRSTSLKFIEEWNEAYGPLYKRISLGYIYIRDVLQLKFPEIRNQNLQRLHEEEERNRQTQQVLLVKYRRIKAQFEESVLNLMLCLKQMDVCFNAIIPDLDELLQRDKEEASSTQEPGTSYEQNETKLEDRTEENFTQNQEQYEDIDLEDDQTDNKVGENEDEWETVAMDEFDDIQELIFEHGLGNLNYSITITLNRSFQDLKNADNEELFTILQENLTELERTFEPMVDEWVKVLGMVKMEGEEAATRIRMLKRCLELREWLTRNKEKCTDLGIKTNVLSSRKLSIYRVPELSISDLCLKQEKLKRKGENIRENANKKRKS